MEPKHLRDYSAYTAITVTKHGRVSVTTFQNGRLAGGTIYASWPDLLQRRKPFAQPGPIVVQFTPYGFPAN